MGQMFSMFGRFFHSSKPLRILMLGLDAAGKTTILYQLKVGEAVTTIPTIGFNVEEVQYKNVTFTVWDVGGGNKIKQLWHNYYQYMQGIIFVVDSSDQERFDEANCAFTFILEAESMKDAKVLIYANKKDLPGAVDPSVLIEKVGFSRKDANDWRIQPTNATTGEGLIEGLAWLDSQLR